MTSISVSATIADRIRRLIATKGFSSQEEVIDAALNALESEQAGRTDDLAWVKARITASVEDTRPGYTSEDMSDHLRELFERARKRHDSAA